MTTDKFDKLEQELKEALHAIEILTNRLISLAVIENKFLSLVEELRNQELKCSGILFNIEAAEKRVEDKTKYLKLFFSFRYKWIERFIMKRDTY
jgi:hypothetical protein